MGFSKSQISFNDNDQDEFSPLVKATDENLLPPPNAAAQGEEDLTSLSPYHSCEPFVYNSPR